MKDDWKYIFQGILTAIAFIWLIGLSLIGLVKFCMWAFK